MLGEHELSLAISSTVIPASIARPSSAIISDALSPTICAPRRRPSSLRDTSFTKPSVASSASARPLAANGNLPATTS